MNKISRGRPKQYYYITEDPPIVVPDSNSVSIKRKLPPNSKYFFIDFFDQCNLRIMTKTIGQDSGFRPHSLEKYGRNIITNIEDCSPSEQKVAKFEEQHNKTSQKKNKVRIRVKRELDRSKQKYKSKSVFTIKQQARDFYNSFHTIDSSQQKSRNQIFKVQSQRQKYQVLGKLGLLPLY